jgi:hypothetical protein
MPRVFMTRGEREARSSEFYPDVLAAHPGPAGMMVAHINVQEMIVVGANPTSGKLRDLQREFIHLLQR